MLKKSPHLWWLLLPLALTACQGLDVVGNGSAASFDALIQAMPNRVMPDENIGGYALEAPDGSTRFLWSQDFSQDSVYDAWLETDITPFVEAGLQTGRLPEGMVHEGILVLGVDFGSNPPSYTGEPTPLKAYGEIIQSGRESIGYHAALDHYGVNLGGGHMFEWAKDMSANDKDIVFVLNPKPFADAGADPDKIPGWLHAKVDIMNAKGKRVQADKLLKPFNIQ